MLQGIFEISNSQPNFTHLTILRHAANCPAFTSAACGARKSKALPERIAGMTHASCTVQKGTHRILNHLDLKHGKIGMFPMASRIEFKTFPSSPCSRGTACTSRRLQSGIPWHECNLSQGWHMSDWSLSLRTHKGGLAVHRDHNFRKAHSFRLSDCRTVGCVKLESDATNVSAGRMLWICVLFDAHSTEKQYWRESFCPSSKWVSCLSSVMACSSTRT